MYKPILFCYLTEIDGKVLPFNPNITKETDVLEEAENCNEAIDSVIPFENRTTDEMMDLIAEFMDTDSYTITPHENSVSLTLTSSDLLAILRQELSEQTKFIDLQSKALDHNLILNSFSGEAYNALTDDEKQLIRSYSVHQSNFDILLMFSKPIEFGYSTVYSRKSFLDSLIDLSFGTITLEFSLGIMDYHY